MENSDASDAIPSGLNIEKERFPNWKLKNKTRNQGTDRFRFWTDCENDDQGQRQTIINAILKLSGDMPNVDAFEHYLRTEPIERLKARHSHMLKDQQRGKKLL